MLRLSVTQSATTHAGKGVEIAGLVSIMSFAWHLTFIENTKAEEISALLLYSCRRSQTLYSFIKRKKVFLSC
jgi:hypothetical protein